MPSRPVDIFFGQPITQTALPRSIAIDILYLNHSIFSFINIRMGEQLDTFGLHISFKEKFRFIFYLRSKL